MKNYLIAGVCALGLTGVSQAQTLPDLGGLTAVPSLPAAPALPAVPALPAAPSLGGGSALPIPSLPGNFSGNPAGQGQAVLDLLTTVGTNGIQAGPTALPAILLEGQSPLAAFGAPTIVDPFDPNVVPGLYGSFSPVAPLRDVIPPSAVAEFFQIAFGGDGPFVVTGLTNAVNSGNIPFASAFPAAPGLPAGDLPIPAGSLDPATLTGLLGGQTLPGL